jgi:hypothetical protein
MIFYYKIHCHLKKPFDYNSKSSELVASYDPNKENANFSTG